MKGASAMKSQVTRLLISQQLREGTLPQPELVAEKVGCSLSLVYRILSEYGIKPEKRCWRKLEQTIAKLETVD